MPRNPHSVPPPARQHPEGGFGGGPYQLAHLAPTYAAVAALVTLGGQDALSGLPAVLCFEAMTLGRTHAAADGRSLDAVRLFSF